MKKISVDLNGNFEITVKIKEDCFVTVNSEGDIIETDMSGSVSYYHSGYDAYAGKISSIGGVSFSYYHSGYGAYAGKLSSGNTNFTISGITFRIRSN